MGLLYDPYAPKIDTYTLHTIFFDHSGSKESIYCYAASISAVDWLAEYLSTKIWATPLIW